MPNHCSNNLRITGPPDKVKEFIDGVDKEKGIFATYMPIPKELQNSVSGSAPPGIVRVEEEVNGKTEYRDLSAEESTAIFKKHGACNWFDWCMEAYGTKWGDYNLYFEDGQDWFGFDSAWGPPMEGLEKLSIMFPELTFDLEYDEPGMGFAGQNIFKNGSNTEIWYDDNYIHPDLIDEEVYELDWRELPTPAITFEGYCKYCRQKLVDGECKKCGAPQG
jgi:hypothetical protein